MAAGRKKERSWLLLSLLFGDFLGSELPGRERLPSSLQTHQHVAGDLLQPCNGRVARLGAAIPSASGARCSLPYTQGSLLSPLYRQGDLEKGETLKQPALWKYLLNGG